MCYVWSNKLESPEFEYDCVYEKYETGDIVRSEKKNYLMRTYGTLIKC